MTAGPSLWSLALDPGTRTTCELLRRGGATTSSLGVDMPVSSGLTSTAMSAPSAISVAMSESTAPAVAAVAFGSGALTASAIRSIATPASGSGTSMANVACASLHLRWRLPAWPLVLPLRFCPRLLDCPAKPLERNCLLLVITKTHPSDYHVLVDRSIRSIHLFRFYLIID